MGDNGVAGDLVTIGRLIFRLPLNAGNDDLHELPMPMRAFLIRFFWFSLFLALCALVVRAGHRPPDSSWGGPIWTELDACLKSRAIERLEFARGSKP
jgi:hypothetical protein